MAFRIHGCDTGTHWDLLSSNHSSKLSLVCLLSSRFILRPQRIARMFSHGLTREWGPVTFKTTSFAASNASSSLINFPSNVCCAVVGFSLRYSVLGVTWRVIAGVQVVESFFPWFGLLMGMKPEA